ncbi:hypothetical protein [Sphingomonas sp.]|uniref:hypothetical protein n=1 Tax=Sphingomonas sp. TaxID=28214 RepID=UPI003BAC1AFF
MTPPRPTRVEFGGTVESMSQVERPSLAIILPGIGPVVTHHAAFAFVGEHSEPSGDSIVLAVGRKPCGCGCGATGVAFMAYLPADEARVIAERLVNAAEAAEAIAARQAAAAINKARGR